MYSFLEKHPVAECSRILDKISPIDVVSLAKFFPIASVSLKKNSITVVYIVNPKSRFRGKAKTRVEVDRTSSTLRLVGRGDVSFEVRFNCANDILTVYFVVTGKLIDMIPRNKAKEIFDDILNYIRVKARETGALIPEAPAEAAPPPQPLTIEAQQPEPSMQQLQPPPPEPAASPAPLEPGEAAQAAEALEGEAAAPAGEPAFKTAGVGEEGFSVTACMAKLFTAGLQLDEELSKRIPFEYAPKLRLSPLVEMGEKPVGELDFTRYTDGYLVRLTRGGVRVDSLRAQGRVGLYLRSDGREVFSSEALWSAVNEFCTEPRRKAFYIVVKV